MSITASFAISSTMQILNSMKPHELGNHAVVWGTYPGGQSAPQTVMLGPNYNSYVASMMEFGRLTKRMGIYAEVSVLVINGMLPNLGLRPTATLLAMTRGGNYHQVIVDFKGQKAIFSENISEEDKAVVSAVFLGQAFYKPDIDAVAIWN